MKPLPVKTVFTFLLALAATTGFISGSHTENNNSMGTLYQDTLFIRNRITIDSFYLKIVPPSSGVSFYKDNIIFLSDTREESKMLSQHVSFGTLQAFYAFPARKLTGAHTLFSPLASFPYPCDALTFNASGDTMYFTRLHSREKKEKIYMARYGTIGSDLGSWITSDEPLNFCTGEYRFSHPALSPDGTMMVFASDNSGSAGGMDLFLVRKTGSEWSEPVNLGKEINSAGNEFFPVLDCNNNLYFSSDGLAGFGGFDIFTCKFNGTGWDKPKNLSAVVNTVDDEIAFTINSNECSTAFFTRRQIKPKGNMQLYRIGMANIPPKPGDESLASIFNGKPSANEILLAEAPVLKKEVKSEQLNLPKTEPTAPAEQKKEVDAPETKALPVNTPEVSKPVEKPFESSKQVIYRVQIASSIKSKDSYKFAVGDRTYSTYEYYYKDAFRQTIGEFTALSQAKALQDYCRKSGQAQAFVVAFLNGERSLDPSLFK